MFTVPFVGPNVLVLGHSPLLLCWVCPAYQHASLIRASLGFYKRHVDPFKGRDSICHILLDYKLDIHIME